MHSCGVDVRLGVLGDSIVGVGSGVGVGSEVGMGVGSKVDVGSGVDVGSKVGMGAFNEGASGYSHILK